MNGPFAALPARDAIGKARGEPFSARVWAPPPAPPARPASAPVAAAQPAAPPMPYRVAGKVVLEGGAHVVLAKGDRVLWVAEGETLDDGFRVESIDPDRVTLVYVPLGARQDLPVASALGVDAPPAAIARAPSAPVSTQPAAGGSSGPAKLRWEGPQQVRAGDSFKVALKVTSAQAVRASPLLLSFDARLLEPVSVRAGGFFAGGSFSYRVNPSGSIFVGASGNGAVPADAELLVVTFKPIRAGATAELRLSSVLLQGAAGRAVAHDAPSVFRTAIVQ